MLSCQRDHGSLGPTVAGPFWKTVDGRRNLVVTQLALHRVEGHAAQGRGPRGAGRARSADGAAGAVAEVACRLAELRSAEHSALLLWLNYLYLILTTTLQS